MAGEYFEKLCTKKPEYVEFYVPATQRPDWYKVEDKMRKEFGSSKDKWDREMLALFSQASEGVYKNSLVRAAQQNYQYGDMQPAPGFIYTMGVDWNKEHGTEIVIVGTQKAEPHVSWVVHAENIPKKDFDSPMGLDRIVTLNRQWMPQKI